MLPADAIIWPDSTRSRPSPHPSVIIANKSTVKVGPGVFVGQGKGVVPLDDANAPSRARCAILDGVSYCHERGATASPGPDPEWMPVA